MSDAQVRATGSPRRNPLPFVAAAVVLAFLAGLALMALATTRYRWLGVAADSVASLPRAAAPAVMRRPTAPASTPPALPTPTDPATLATREAMLGAQLAAIEARVVAVNSDANTAAAQAGRAEAMLLAFAARRAIDRGLGLGELERPLRTRFVAAQPRAVAMVVAGSRVPLTLEDLRAGLDALSPNLLTGGSGWWSGLRGELGSLVVIHRAGTPSPVPADRLARIRLHVAAGQVEAALAEVDRMPGAAVAGNWIAAARRYVDVHRALDTLEVAALSVPQPSPRTAAPPPTPPAATGVPVIGG